MRKYLLSIIGLLFTGTAAYAQPTSSILLQHEGNVEVYPVDSLNAALRDAVDGDTLFLSKGVYHSFTIDKKITVRGSGEETVVAGTITVAIPETATLTATLLEGISMNDYNGDVVVTMPVNGFKMKQCKFFNLKLDAVMENVFIDRCVCNSRITLSGEEETYITKVKSMQITQSKIRAFAFDGVTTNDIMLTNCLTKGFFNGQNFRGAVINSIVGWPGNVSYTYDSCTFINSLICTYRITLGASCYTENCWTSENEYLVENPYSTNFGCMYNSEELQEKGYIGNDGTIVGCYGGTHPLTLELAVPKVASSIVRVDNENRKLNVKLTLTAE